MIFCGTRKSAVCLLFFFTHHYICLQIFYRFTDGDPEKVFTCESKGKWTPTPVVPDCVSEDTTLSTYDVAATGNFLYFFDEKNHEIT